MKLTRIAPTPSGFLHLGNAYSFILTYLIAKNVDAKIMLRIDDLDKTRKRPEYVEDIFYSLAWLGIPYDLGPTSVQDFEQNYSQHKRLELYAEALQILVQNQQIYGCRCSRKQIAARSPLLYDRFCEDKAYALETDKTAWRIKNKGVKISFEDAHLGTFCYDLDAQMPDFVVRRKDKLPAYQLASLIDDVHFGIDGIVRGQDLLGSTAAQFFLAQKLPTTTAFAQSIFYHHPLLKKNDEQKLSKSKGDIALQYFRKAGHSPAFLYEAVAKSMKWNFERLESLEELLWLSQNQAWAWCTPLLEDFER